VVLLEWRANGSAFQLGQSYSTGLGADVLAMGVQPDRERNINARSGLAAMEDWRSGWVPSVREFGVVLTGKRIAPFVCDKRARLRRRGGAAGCQPLPKAQ